MNDRHAISLRINAAISAHPSLNDKSKKRLSNGGVRRWIEAIEDYPILESDKSAEGGQIFNPSMNQSVTALRMR
jgi:hypothetical protein